MSSALTSLASTKTKASSKASKLRAKLQKIVAEETPDPAYVNSDGRLCLTHTNLWRFRALNAEAEKAGLQHLKAKTDFEAIVSSTPSLMGCRQMMAISKAELSKVAEEMKEFQREVEAGLKIPMSRCAIDDRTGIIEVVIEKSQDEILNK